MWVPQMSMSHFLWGNNRGRRIARPIRGSQGMIAVFTTNNRGINGFIHVLRRGCPSRFSAVRSKFFSVSRKEDPLDRLSRFTRAMIPVPR